MKGLVLYSVIVTIVQTRAQKVNVNFAVSPITGFEQFYLQIKSSRSYEKRGDEEAQSVKLRICQSIISSSLFRTRHECADAGDAGNAYRLQTIIVQGKRVEERSFSCQCKKKTGSSNQYYVSHEYNFDQSGRETGRFIFLGDTVVAVAEQPATIEVTDRMKIEQTFWETIHVSWHTRWNSNNVLCQLSAFEKLRRCNTILNANGYQELVEFEPDAKNIEPGCILRRVRFDQYEAVEKDNTADEPNLYKPVGPVKEWVIPCKCVLKETRESIKRYIVRGSQNQDNHKYFVAIGGEEEDDALYLETFIGDEMKQEETRSEQKQQQTGQEEEEEEEEGPSGFHSRGGGGGAEDFFSFFTNLGKK